MTEAAYYPRRDYRAEKDTILRALALARAKAQHQAETLRVARLDADVYGGREAEIEALERNYELAVAELEHAINEAGEID